MCRPNARETVRSGVWLLCNGVHVRIGVHVCNGVYVCVRCVCGSERSAAQEASVSTERALPSFARNRYPILPRTCCGA